MARRGSRGPPNEFEGSTTNASSEEPATREIFSARRRRVFRPRTTFLLGIARTALCSRRRIYERVEEKKTMTKVEEISDELLQEMLSRARALAKERNVQLPEEPGPVR